VYLLWSITNNKLNLAFFFIILASLSRQNSILLAPLLFVLILTSDFSNKNRFFLLLPIPYIIFLATLFYSKNINSDDSELLNNGLGIFYLLTSGYFLNLKNSFGFILFFGMSLFYTIPFLIICITHLSKQFYSSNIILIILLLLYIIQPIIGGPVSVGYNNAARHIATIIPFATLIFFRNIEFKNVVLIYLVLMLYSLFPPFNNLIFNLKFYIFSVALIILTYIFSIKHDSKFNINYYSSKK
jgi:hypothetical protein